MEKFSAVAIEQLLMQLQSSEQGLTETLAQSRLQLQKSKEKTESRFHREFKLLIRQFSNPLVFLLIVAVILSAILGETSDTIIILSILLATGLLSFFQERNAGRAVERLQELIKKKAEVLRDGNSKEILAEDIVAGDILLLSAGNIIPADCRIISSNELHVNESSVTGESYPVEKQTGVVDDDATLSSKYNCLWKGTSVISGTAKVLVVNTGSDTLFGQMQKSLSKQPETAFEQGIRKFGYFLLQITLVLSVILLAVNIYFKRPLFDSILFSLAIAVGMAPELLPAIMTFAMSAGAKRMLKKKVIVKKLSSIFNFGEVNVLCTDKTGTITEGTVTVKDVVDISKESNDELKRFAFLNASLQNGFANPMDDALKALNIDISGYEKINEIPYDFIRRRLTVSVKKDNQYIIISKGAVSNILTICSSYKNEQDVIEPLDSIKDKVQQQYAALSEGGLRVIGICYRTGDSEKITKESEIDMIFGGFILLEDPLKESAIASLKKLREQQVETKIITGDNRYIARYTAEKIGFNNPVILCGDELNKMSPEALKIKAKETNVFAEIEPHQKERIVITLQSCGMTVAYMGDGINDVAAIHAADTGISVNDAVDVAKEAADFVLLEKDLSVLSDGIYEGRKSFANSMKYILINTGATFGTMCSMAGASLLLPFLPMLPKQILLTNFLTDFPFLYVASDNVDEDQMAKPGKWSLKTIRAFMIVFGIHTTVFDFITFFVLYNYFHLKNSSFQTGWFLESTITQLLIVFIIRTRKSFMKSKPSKWLLITSIICLVVTILLPVSPFANLLGLRLANFQQVVAIVLILIGYVITANLLKIVFFRTVEKQIS
ncbi:MAG: magnesium-translocating P-type ATPase [Sphingobacteriales bacterium]|nr:MAG: magnesium-translocating P-type ATPase [Sphingobacteriales bacterium]